MKSIQNLIVQMQANPVLEAQVKAAVLTILQPDARAADLEAFLSHFASSPEELDQLRANWGNGGPMVGTTNTILTTFTITTTGCLTTTTTTTTTTQLPQ